MAVTINDIAKKAGVSQATVSRVLNNSGYVKEETREKVLKVIKEANYTPSAIARSLSTNKTNTVGVIVPDINDPFFGEIIKGISEIADKHGLNIIFFDTDERVEKELKAIKLLEEQRIRGILITPTSTEDKYNSECLKALNNSGTPVILIDGHVKYSDFSGIFADNIEGGYEGTEALIKAGHTKIAVITGRMNSRPARDRFEGYKKALESNDIPIDERYIFHSDYTQESSYKITKQILAMEDRPTAIFVNSNMMTLGCMKALSEESIRIPEDIAIIGFDKLDILNILGMNISFVSAPTMEMGRNGMKMLIDSLKNKQDKEIKRITLSPELSLNGSERYINK